METGDANTRKYYMHGSLEDISGPELTTSVPQVRNCASFSASIRAGGNPPASTRRAKQETRQKAQ